MLGAFGSATDIWILYSVFQEVTHVHSTESKGKGPLKVAPHSPNLMSPSPGSGPSSAASATQRVDNCSPRALKDI